MVSIMFRDAKIEYSGLAKSELIVGRFGKEPGRCWQESQTGSQRADSQMWCTGLCCIFSYKLINPDPRLLQRLPSLLGFFCPCMLGISSQSPIQCTVQLLPQQGIDLNYCDIDWFALERNRDHSIVFEIASKYCISDSFLDYEGYSISSKGFLPTVVDIMVIWIKFTHSSPF